MTSRLVEQIERQGFALIEDAVDKMSCAQVLYQFQAETSGASLRSSRGTVFAARNLIDEFEPSTTIWRQPALMALLTEVLGPDAGLVRVLYFDKPSHRSWTLPWHKDMTVSVVDNQIQSAHFCKPTRKAGVPHFEASTSVLEQMLTLRLHLDPVSDRNGPLRVIPGSHSSGKQPVASSENVHTVYSDVGGVLAMRPLISHSSGHTDEAGGLNRRILHFEFSGLRQLPDNVMWHRFIPVLD